MSAEPIFRRCWCGKEGDDGAVCFACLRPTHPGCLRVGGCARIDCEPLPRTQGHAGIQQGAPPPMAR